MSCYFRVSICPTSNFSRKCKNEFYEDLQCVFTKFHPNEAVVVNGDVNSHFGEKADGYEGIHGGKGYGSRNKEGESLLEFAMANNMVVTNTHFTKKENHLVTYNSGPYQSQVDYVLTRKQHLSVVRDVKVIPGEECIAQHHTSTIVHTQASSLETERS